MQLWKVDERGMEIWMEISLVLHDAIIDVTVMIKITQSIMHYGARDFGINGQITIRTLDPTKQNVIGKQREVRI